jgi:peptidoglycan/LPS O-acetylase OafA/YrhL
MGVLLALAWTAPEVREWLRRQSHLLPWAMLAFTGTAAVLIHLIRIHVRNALLLNAFAGRTLVELSCLSLMLFVLTRPDSRFCGLLRTRFLRQSGKFSYCLYLAHFGVLWMISRFVMHSELGLRPWRDVASALISLPLLYVLATLSWKFIEEPLIRRGHRYKF